MIENNTLQITIFLKHDQSMNLEQIDDILYKQGFWLNFPPVGAKIISWQVMMGIGQVITLETTPDKVRQVNLAIEKMAWGAFRTEFYLTYDFLPVLEKKRQEAAKRSQKNENI